MNVVRAIVPRSSSIFCHVGVENIDGGQKQREGEKRGLVKLRRERGGESRFPRTVFECRACIHTIAPLTTILTYLTHRANYCDLRYLTLVGYMGSPEARGPYLKASPWKGKDGTPTMSEDSTIYVCKRSSFWREGGS